MRTTKLISLITSVLVLALAVAAFVLSYDALQALAVANGVETHLAWIWPFVIDGFLIVASLSVLRNGLLGEKALYPWALVVLFTGASIAFNIAHAPEALLARVVGAIPPLALALAFELLMGQLKSEVKRGQAVKTLAQLTQSVSQKRQALNGLTQNVNAQRETLTEVSADVNAQRETLAKLSADVDEKRQELTELTSAIDDVKAENVNAVDSLDVNTAVLNKARLTRDAEAQEAIDTLLTFYLNNPDASQSEAAEAADRSRSWVSMRLSELEAEGLVNRNGNGVQVLT
jgi:DNA-binding transcriptional regulator GbsR (MarR family)